MVSAVIAYSDRIPLDSICSYHGLQGPGNDCIKGQHFRDLLHAVVMKLNSVGIEDIVVVNYGNSLYPTISIDGALVINFKDSLGFSEWNAKHVGIKASRYDKVITLNSDILVNKSLISWFCTQIENNKLRLYQGTKGWLNKDQTLYYLATGELYNCFHEVWVSIINNNEVPQCGIEPITWCGRRNTAKKYQDLTGLDLWKHSGDFQAFHKDILSIIDYPLGSYGWGWGDIELRLRFKEAGLDEIWNSNFPVWHMYHPYYDWSRREKDCLANMRLWNRDISLGNSSWVSPPKDEIDILKIKSGKFCCLNDICIKNTS